MKNQSHRRFEAIFQQSAIAMIIYNRKGECIEVNRAWQKVFESTKEELTGYNPLIDPQLHESGINKCFESAFEGNVVHAPPIWYDPKKSGAAGRGRWLTAIFSPVKDESGDVTEVAIMFNDITDLKLAQEELARSRDQLESVFNQLPEAVLILDLEYKVLYSNAMAMKFAGIISFDEWKSQTSIMPHFEYFKEDGSPMDPEEFPSRVALRDGKTSEVFMKFRNKNTSEDKVVLALGQPLKNENGDVYGVVCVYRDITDKIRIETELREALKSKNLFFSVASHELRTPITALKLNAQLMHLTYPNITLESVAKLDRQVGKLTKLVEDMLDISRLSRGRLDLNKKDVNLSQLTREVLYEMMDQLKLAGITLTMNVNEDVSGFWDPDRLEQVVENLVTNAIRYARKSPLLVRVVELQDKVILEVCDQGPGIPAEDFERIFNQFERSRSIGERSGMGLGLFIVKEIVTLHGGTISVSNLNTGGARFIIELPKMHS